MAWREAAAQRLHLFGIRHHGPGSTHSLLAALDTVDPGIVLIEGPPDANDILRFAASPWMRPPVALLVHGREDPATASFYPFAVFSPEWQAMRWALAKNRPVRFIDLPAANRLALRHAILESDNAAVPDQEPGPAEASDGPDRQPEATAEQAELAAVLRDPLAYLAAIAGYDDSEAWWNALIEQSANAPSIFGSIEAAMEALRMPVDELPPLSVQDRRLETLREGHMRLAAAAALRETDGNVALVCGAWHVPALRRRISPEEDSKLLKELPKIKVDATWIPWTDTRLAAASGYGAGVKSPGWYAHLWNEIDSRAKTGLDARNFTGRWQSRVAGLLRTNGRQASTASVIDATRLAEALASLRDLALPGLDEMREASLATLCAGENAAWQLV